MEEVWKDYMSLQSSTTPAAAAAFLYCHQQPSPPDPSPPSSYRAGNGILQDFLAPAAPAVARSFSAPQTPPPTALSLSSTLEFTYLGGGGVGGGGGGSSTSGDDSRDLMIFPFAPAPASGAPSCCQTMNKSSSGSSGSDDRRHRRMIKNRESAARSRARKQAYTNELELALAQLRREKEMLIKRHQELNVRLAVTSAQVLPDHRPTVQRCRSAPP